MKKHLSTLLSLSLSLSLCLLFTGCGGGSSSPPNTNSAAITISHSPLSFVVNGSGDITVTNSGSIPLTNLTAMPASTGHLTISSTTCTSSIAAGSSCTYVLTDNTVEDTTITFNGSDSQNHSLSVTLSVNVSATGSGEISASPSPLTLTTAQNGTLTITNTGTDTITGFAATLNGHLSQVATTCSSRISVNASCTYTLVDNTAETTSIQFVGTDILNHALSLTVPVTVSTASTAIITESTTAISGVATVETNAVTLTNTGTVTATGLTYTLSPSSGYTPVTNNCGSTLAPQASCTYAIYTTQHGTVTVSIAGSNLSSTPHPLTFTINPVAATILEDAAQSHLLDFAALSAVNMIFIDTGSLDTTYNPLTLPFSYMNDCPANPPAAQSAFFDYFATDSLNGTKTCQDFSAIVSDYSKPTVVWVSSSTAPLDTTYNNSQQLKTIADNIAATIVSQDGASGIGLELSGQLFSSSTADQQDFLVELAKQLYQPSNTVKTLFLYEPYGSFTPTLNAALAAYPNVVAMIPLYDLYTPTANTCGPDNNAGCPQTTPFTGGTYTTLASAYVRDAIIGQYSGLPFMYMAPASGTDFNWQSFSYADSNYNPYPNNTAPTGINSSANTYTNAYPGGQTDSNYYSPTGNYSQLFSYTLEALCTISTTTININSNILVINSPNYTGTMYYAVRPTGYFNSAKYATYPENVPDDGFWNLLKDWTSSPTPICGS